MQKMWRIPKGKGVRKVSNNLRQYKSLDVGIGNSNIDVTAFVGGEYGYSVQFTIGDRYCALAENQVRDLISVLQKRVRSIKKYKATSSDLDIRVFPKLVKEIGL